MKDKTLHLQKDSFTFHARLLLYFDHALPNRLL